MSPALKVAVLLLFVCLRTRFCARRQGPQAPGAGLLPRRPPGGSWLSSSPRRRVSPALFFCPRLFFPALLPLPPTSPPPRRHPTSLVRPFYRAAWTRRPQPASQGWRPWSLTPLGALGPPWGQGLRWLPSSGSARGSRREAEEAPTLFLPLFFTRGAFWATPLRLTPFAPLFSLSLASLLPPRRPPAIPSAPSPPSAPPSPPGLLPLRPPAGEPVTGAGERGAVRRSGRTRQRRGGSWRSCTRGRGRWGACCRARGGRRQEEGRRAGREGCV